jgi:hypothetical protein
MYALFALAIVAAIVVVMGSVAVTLAPEADARTDQRSRNDLTQNAGAGAAGQLLSPQISAFKQAMYVFFASS